jgi:hypothetical protein
MVANLRLITLFLEKISLQSQAWREIRSSRHIQDLGGRGGFVIFWEGGG